MSSEHHFLDWIFLKDLNLDGLSRRKVGKEDGICRYRAVSPGPHTRDKRRKNRESAINKPDL